MRALCAVAFTVLATGSALGADYYDAAYVSSPVVCERAGEKPVMDLLFEEDAWLVLPRQSILAGEMGCRLYNVQEITGVFGGGPEILATARCHGFEIDFLDQVVIEADSFGINQSFGDDGVEHQLGEKVEIVSMRADATPPDYENYAGLYTRCDALTEEAMTWAE
ncbi:MAG: hypothetical protein EOP18_13550 [Rhizobiaceae bacterium]|nr:MAG: hypothetical protein EOP18_13550 [Rhizobiaceae bacterium]